MNQGRVSPASTNGLEINPDYFSLVGEFLWHWAQVETEFGKTIETLLGLDESLGFILTDTIGFTDKAKILRISINILFPDPARNDQFLAIVQTAEQLYRKRNTIAHSNFATAPKNNGLVFFRTRTAKKARKSETFITLEEFQSTKNKSEEIVVELEKIRQAARKRANVKKLLMDALLAGPALNRQPTILGVLLGNPNDLSRQD